MHHKLKIRLAIFITKVRYALSEITSGVIDLLLFKLNIPVSKSKVFKRLTDKNIIFIGEHLPPRIPRLAKWIKKTEPDIKTVLLCHQNGYISQFVNPNGFDIIILFRNPWHLRRILSQFSKINIIHAFAPKSFYPNIARKYKKPDTRFVQDMQDVYNIYYSYNIKLRWLQKELPHERTCLIEADGIVAHSLEPNVALRQFKVEKKPKTIFFPLYCDNDIFIKPQKNNLLPEHIHLVYAGGVAGRHRNPKTYGNIQFHGLIKILAEQKLHFHIYPSPSNLKADYEEYEKIASENDYFHFHLPVGQADLSKELAKYHFGIHLGNINQDVHKQSSLKYKYCTTLKLFNFMEAGIPIIISNNLTYQSWLIERYHMGIVLKKDLSKLRNIIESYSYDKLIKNVINNREKLSMRNNINRLIFFYDKIKKHG